MLNDQPNLPGQGKIVLPPYPEEHYLPPMQTQHVYVHPDQLRPQTHSVAGNPVTRLRVLWGLDPAYKVLIVAVTMVVVAGLMFTFFLFNAFAQSTPKAATTPHVTLAAVTATSVPNIPPTFPTPSGGQGSKQSSLPPESAPVVLPTLTPASQGSQQGSQQLALQIVDVAQQVSNNSTVPVTVNANQPGVTVSLQITYDFAATNTVGPQDTGGDGAVTLNWHVRLRNFGFKVTQVARITAFATDQNGQQVQSQTVSIEVTNRMFN